MKATGPGRAGAAAAWPGPMRGRLDAAMTGCGSQGAPGGVVGVACGIDVVELGRFRRIVALRGNLFFATVYTPRELADCVGCLERLASRFAAKEAMSKALGCGIGPVGWRELETCTDRDGKPRVRLHGRAARRARSLGLVTWALTLTHTRVLAMAMVVACGAAPDAVAAERLGPWRS